MSLTGYQVLQKIYAGTHSLIYKAERKHDHQPVIIKILQQEYPTPSQLAKFRQEYEITYNLNSDSIVKAYALEKQQSTLAIILEDFGGESLKALMASQKFTISQFLDLAIKVTNVLSQIHALNIIHKDINPANILLNPLTNQIKITDFGISTVLSRENTSIKNPNILEGTLAYISPEQTGRMNRSIDYRSDFYSLGVTFYELLTHQLPFNSKDPMELVHCHIAKQPCAPCEVNPTVPQPISQIVMKLLAKTAEERYQSAFGIKSDLETCLQQWQSSGQILEFPLGSHDISEKFQIPQKLYGREQEVATLLTAFERVSQGERELMLISGYSGIGKSSLVEEIYKPITRQRGYFISGKFDQFQRNIPYSAVVSAFRSLIKQILTESTEEIKQWKDKILAALGANGQLIIQVIPEVELIIGKQPPVGEVAATESQNRFNLLFQNFIHVFSQREHPLVIFIDDLQWADSASLKLLELMMIDAETKYLFLIGAYRDNEVTAGHPLKMLFETLQKQRVITQQIFLESLSLEHITTLIAETFHCDRTDVTPLAELVMQKTSGNPFFTRQFLQSLYEDDLLTFNFKQGIWDFHLQQIQQQGFTDNVVELLGSKIQKLPLETQEILKIAACIGKRFCLHTLALMQEQPTGAIALALWEAVQQDLILLLDNNYQLLSEYTEEIDHLNNLVVPYQFVHDRVQQAAYSLIPEAECSALHLQIGQLMMQDFSADALAENLFDVVNQLNLGSKLISHPPAKEELAQLNLQAGKKAKVSTAYEPALRYFTTGISLLPENCWETCYQLSCELHINYAEALSVLGELDQAEQVFQSIFKNIQNSNELALCHEKYSEILQSSGKAAQAFNEVILGLDILGITLPVSSAEIEQEQEILLAELMQKETIERFSALEIANERDTLIGKLYDKGIISCYFSQPQKLTLVVSKSVKHILDSGITPQSGIAIAWFATLLAIMERKELSFSYAELALHLVHQFPEVYFRGETMMLAHAQSLGWKYSFDYNEKSLQEAYTLCHSTGNLQFASYCLICAYISKMVRSTDCREVYESCKQWHDYCEKYVPLELGQAKIRLYYLNQLMDVTEQCIDIDVEAILQKYTAEQNYTDVSESLVEIVRIESLLGNYSVAYQSAKRAKPMLATGSAGSLLVNMTFTHFYALCCARLYSQEESPELKQQYLAELQLNLAKLKHWAEISSDNFYSYYLLIEGELARALQNYNEANNYYLQTIEHAREHNYTLLQAFATELLGELYWLEHHRFATGMFEEAHYLYLQCGATKKAKILEEKFPQVFKHRFGISQTLETTLSEATTTRGGLSLDLHTVIKASQALASEIVLEVLLKKLMQILLENAGAEKGFLIFCNNGELRIEAEGEVGQDEVIVLQSILVERSDKLAMAIINYVARAQESVVLNYAAREGKFVTDPYIVKFQPKSILCIPILNQGKLVALLYLENNLTSRAFTPERVEVLKLLSSQAAASLENAILYNNLETARANLQRANEQLAESNRTLEQKVEERTLELREKALQLEKTLQELQQTQTQLIQTEKMSSLGQMVAGVAHEINNPVNFISGNIEHTSIYLQDLLGLIKVYQQEYPELTPAIQDEIEAIDFGHIVEDLPKMLSSMKLGADRIRQIVLSLRNFSRLDEAAMKKVKIEEGIESTLLILQHRLKEKAGMPTIQLIKEYGNLPLVECYAGQLNQVFMNILSNAIDALEEKDTKRTLEERQQNPSTIWIRTETASDNRVRIRIIDNGLGMTEATKNKLFDPFFTTKAVGSGTGLGLSISYQIIVDKHSGQLSCLSQPGQGAEFLIEIPVNQRNESKV